NEKNGGEHGRHARQEVRRAGGAEETAGGAATEARAHVGALAVLQKHEADNRERDQHVKHDQYGCQHCNLTSTPAPRAGSPENPPPRATRRRSSRHRRRASRKSRQRFVASRYRRKESAYRPALVS